MPRTDPRQCTADTPISRARLAAGMTQKASGCGKSSLSRWENGKCAPRTETLIKIAKALGCSIDDLIETGEEQYKPKGNNK